MEKITNEATAELIIFTDEERPLRNVKLFFTGNFIFVWDPETEKINAYNTSKISSIKGIVPAAPKKKQMRVEY